MSSFLKGMLVILLIIYVASPVDLCPGPIDDLILLLCCAGGGAVTNAIED